LVTDFPGGLSKHSLPEALRGDVGQALEVDINQAKYFRIDTQASYDLVICQVLQQGGLADAPLAYHGGAFAGAGAQTVDDLAQFLASAVETGRVADGIAVGERVFNHNSSSKKKLFGFEFSLLFIQIPEFYVVDGNMNLLTMRGDDDLVDIILNIIV
jgi:hypothetical protein